MRDHRTAARSGLVACTAALLAVSSPAWADGEDRRPKSAQLGPRPFFLLDKMQESPLRRELEECAARTAVYRPSKFSIGHRGAPLMFPEHTKESYEAAARMGAGILECDVAFTKDDRLVCRHSQCDLHTTTNVLAIPELAARCSAPFRPAEYDAATGELIAPASARCCTTDFTLEEILSLCGKMDASNPRARTVTEYMTGTATWRTELYSTCGTLLSHAVSIELFDSLGADMTPELKAGSVDLDGDGTTDRTQSDFALRLIDEYRAAGISPRRVWPQSFDYDDVLLWVDERPEFGRQAVFLDGRDGVDAADPSAEGLVPPMEDIAAAGVRVIAPPLWYLLRSGPGGEILPSRYAGAARAAGLDIIAWTSERSGRMREEVLEGGGSGSYYRSVIGSLATDGDVLRTIDVLAQEVGVLGIFSDWPATTTFYANCMGIR